MVEVSPVGKNANRYKQSPSEFLPKLSARVIVGGPIGGGNRCVSGEYFAQQEVMAVCFDKICYASGSSKLDHNLKPNRKYYEKELGMAEGECLLDGWDEP